MPKREPRGLGKGVSAILGEVPNADQLRQPIGYINKEIVGIKAKQDTSDILRIPAEMIEANPFQPRKNFDQQALDELTASIKTLGLIQPITVRKISDTKFQIISGERRFRACSQAGMTMIPAYVRDANDRGMLEMAIVENIQRENLDPIEVAMSYQRLIDECSLTQEEMADRVCKKRASVANQLRLLKLPAKIQHDLKVGLLSVGHAKVLLGLDNPELQEQLCDLIVKNGLSVRELENQVRKLSSNGNAKSSKAVFEITEDYNTLSEKLESIFPECVNVRRTSNGKGSVTIKFNSDEKASAFLEILTKAGI